MTARELAEGEILREGRRVLRKLIGPEAELIPSHQASGYVLMVAVRGGLKQWLRLPADLVEVFRRRDWIAPIPGRSQGFTIIDAGVVGSDVHLPKKTRSRSSIGLKIAAP
jgi:hypothetical protein